jgi:hypothetical protein
MGAYGKSKISNILAFYEPTEAVLNIKVLHVSSNCQMIVAFMRLQMP